MYAVGGASQPWKLGGGAILGDDPGLGKTMQALAVVEALVAVRAGAVGRPADNGWCAEISGKVNFSDSVIAAGRPLRSDGMCSGYLRAFIYAKGGSAAPAVRAPWLSLWPHGSASGRQRQRGLCTATLPAHPRGQRRSGMLTSSGDVDP